MTLVSELLLQNGHKVTAVVRDVTKLKVNHTDLSKVQADIFNAESLASIFKGTWSTTHFAYKYLFLIAKSISFVNYILIFQGMKQ